jgi:hypothetical protein
MLSAIGCSVLLGAQCCSDEVLFTALVAVQCWVFVSYHDLISFGQTLEHKSTRILVIKFDCKDNCNKVEFN